MCIVVAKPQGVALPTKRTLRNCFENNDDGAGFMYHDSEGVQIRKGFMGFRKFWKGLKAASLTEDDSIVFHFRIATHGATDGGNCHPFPLTDSSKEMRIKEQVTDIAMAHNGILPMVADHILSDTMLFIRDYLSSPIIRKNIYSDTKIQAMVEEISVGSKLAFLNASGRLYRTGWGWVEDQGCYYSNSTYKYSTKWGDSSPDTEDYSEKDYNTGRYNDEWDPYGYDAIDWETERLDEIAARDRTEIIEFNEFFEPHVCPWCDSSKTMKSAEGNVNNPQFMCWECDADWSMKDAWEIYESSGALKKLTGGVADESST